MDGWTHSSPYYVLVFSQILERRMTAVEAAVGIPPSPVSETSTTVPASTAIALPTVAAATTTTTTLTEATNPPISDLVDRIAELEKRLKKTNSIDACIRVLILLNFCI